MLLWARGGGGAHWTTSVSDGRFGLRRREGGWRAVSASTGGVWMGTHAGRGLWGLALWCPRPSATALDSGDGGECVRWRGPRAGAGGTTWRERQGCCFCGACEYEWLMLRCLCFFVSLFLLAAVPMACVCARVGACARRCDSVYTASGSCGAGSSRRCAPRRPRRLCQRRASRTSRRRPTRARRWLRRTAARTRTRRPGRGAKGGHAGGCRAVSRRRRGPILLAGS